MTHVQHLLAYATVMVAGILTILGLFGMMPDVAHAQTTSTSTVELTIDKKFSGSDEGFTEGDFAFHISGDGVDETVPHGGSIDLGIGTYTVSEVVPNGFDPADWRIQWSGECDGPSGTSTTATVVIDDGNVDHGTLSCLVDNQYRPVADDADDDVATTTVSLEFTKKFSGSEEGFTEAQFSFHITGSSTDETVAHGDSIDLTEGTYTITEVVPNGFDPADWRIQWSGECDGPSGTSTTATIIIDDGNIDHGTLSCWADNQYRPDDGNGGGGNGGGNGDNGEGTLIVVKEVVGTSTAPETFTFEVTGGATSATTSITESFDTDGTNELTLATGTYSVFEIGTTTGYIVTYNNCTDITLAADETETCTITNTLDDDNGGGNGNGDNGNGGSNGDGNGGNGNGSSGGGGSTSLRGDDDGQPSGRIAGEQVSVVPLGAANTGAGGTAPNSGGIVTMFWHWVRTLF